VLFVLAFFNNCDANLRMNANDANREWNRYDANTLMNANDTNRELYENPESALRSREPRVGGEGSVDGVRATDPSLRKAFAQDDKGREGGALDDKEREGSALGDKGREGLDDVNAGAFTVDGRAGALDAPWAEARAKGIRLFRDLFIISVMILIFIIDLKWYLIFDVVTLPAALVVLLMNLYLGVSWQNLLISGIIGTGFFLVQYVVSKGKWIGGGDIRLGLLMGLALGWPAVMAAILIAYFAGSVIGLGLIGLGKKEWGGMVPLGAFLAPAAILVLLYGDRILSFYWRLLGV
jgi:Flp pilus assembly protein protease CpaA